MTEIQRHRSFTKKKKSEPVTFELDGDLFECVKKMPVELTKQISGLKNAESTVARLDMLIDMVRNLLRESSLELFNNRLNNKDEPIDIEEIGEIVEWLVEVYTGRPLVPSEDFVNGSTTETIVNVGTSSMDGAEVEMSIPVSSP